MYGFTARQISLVNVGLSFQHIDYRLVAYIFVSPLNKNILFTR